MTTPPRKKRSSPANLAVHEPDAPQATAEKPSARAPVWAAHAHPRTGLDEKWAEEALAALPDKIDEALRTCADVADFGPVFHHTNDGALGALELLRAARTMVLLDSAQKSKPVVKKAREYSLKHQKDPRVQDDLHDMTDPARALMNWVIDTIREKDAVAVVQKEKTFHQGLLALRRGPERWMFTLARDAADWLVLHARTFRRLLLVLPANFPEDHHVHDAEALLRSAANQIFDVKDATAQVDETKVAHVIAWALLQGFGCKSDKLKKLFSATTKAEWRTKPRGA